MVANALRNHGGEGALGRGGRTEEHRKSDGGDQEHDRAEGSNDPVERTQPGQGWIVVASDHAKVGTSGHRTVGLVAFGAAALLPHPQNWARTGETVGAPRTP